MPGQTKQELAKRLLAIDWLACEADSESENFYLHVIGKELLKMDLPQHELIGFFFQVMKVQGIEVADLKTEMSDFKYINHDTGNYLLRPL